METNTSIQVQFHCHQCQSEIRVIFHSNPFATVRCPQCDYSYSIMRPTIGEEILLDWEKEAVFQKVRADQTEHDKMELMLLVIKVIELLTWRDEGNGHIRAIETLRQWLLLNGVPKALIELLDAKGPAASSGSSPKHKE
ncbi:hypothetical protein [Paenibacillus solani]|uniref:hypothetical protein n=1 Tax=Paenibacillus solani TaxID=1705565 RepID=UPI003D2E38AA